LICHYILPKTQLLFFTLVVSHINNFELSGVYFTTGHLNLLLVFLGRQILFKRDELPDITPAPVPEDPLPPPEPKKAIIKL
jgi:hypothetical protein